MKTWKKIELIQTCSACPEQYDAYLNDYQVGYLRLRHGYFRAEHDGVTVYDSRTIGDGCFDPSERNRHLKKARKAIAKRIKHLKNHPQP